MSEDLPPIPADYAEDDESWIDDDYGRGGSPLSFWTYLIGILAWLAVIFGVWAFVLAIGAYAHDAPPTPTQPLGWAYGWECCSNQDCAPVAESAIGETSEGYVIQRTGEVIAYNDKRIKRSRDEFYHRCAPAGNMDSPRSLCLYVPDRGF